MVQRQKTGELEGKGRLIAAGEVVGSVDYHIELWLEENGSQSVSGSVTADDADLNAAYEKGYCELELDNGKRFLATLSRPAGNKAEIKVTPPRGA